MSTNFRMVHSQVILDLTENYSFWTHVLEFVVILLESSNTDYQGVGMIFFEVSLLFFVEWQYILSRAKLQDSNDVKNLSRTLNELVDCCYVGLLLTCIFTI